MMWLKSHKWNLIPHTSYEIRREMIVRESTHTVMLFDKKYYDVESGKYIRDKLEKLNCYSLADIIDDSTHMSYPLRHYREKERVDDFSPLFNIPKFVPKDDDFDDEIKEEKVVVKKEITKNEISYRPEDSRSNFQTEIWFRGSWKVVYK